MIPPHRWTSRPALRRLSSLPRFPMVLLIHGLLSTAACARPTRPITPDALLAIAASVPALPRPPLPEKDGNKQGYEAVTGILEYAESWMIKGYLQDITHLVEIGSPTSESSGDTVHVSLPAWGTITFVRGDTLKMDMPYPRSGYEGYAFRAWFLPREGAGWLAWTRLGHVTQAYEWWRVRDGSCHVIRGDRFFGLERTIVRTSTDGSGSLDYLDVPNLGFVYQFSASWDASGHGTSPWGNW